LTRVPDIRLPTASSTVVAISHADRQPSKIQTVEYERAAQMTKRPR